MSIINPYQSINWNTINRIVSTSHAHGRSQKAFNNGVSGGLRHFALSNYYPSEPFCPLSDHFTNIPEGTICSPNAEHHNFGINLCHLNGLGCTLVSGNPKGTSPVGMASIGVHNWQGAITAILNTLMFADAGGVTINHPTWTHLSTSLAKQMLDYDVRVLGIEIVNSAGQYDDTAYSYEMWDEILLSGRRCWGFCVPDHGIEKSSIWTGRNILLTNDATNYGCLKAYRDGSFYSKIYDSDLDFSSIELANRTLNIETENADSIHVVIDGQVNDFTGNSASIVIPQNATYARTEAWKEYEWTDFDGNVRQVTDKVFSNPIMLSANNPTRKTMLNAKIARKYDI